MSVEVSHFQRHLYSKETMNLMALHLTQHKKFLSILSQKPKYFSIITSEKKHKGEVVLQPSKEADLNLQKAQT